MIIIQEKRREPRLNALLSASIKGEGEKKRNFSIVRNISGSGIYLTTKQEYQEQSEAECMVTLEDETISFLGKIVRVQVDNPYYGYGIHIARINDKDKQSLYKFINNGFATIINYSPTGSTMDLMEDKSMQEDKVFSSMDMKEFNKSSHLRFQDCTETEGRASRLAQANFPFYASVETYNFDYQIPEVKEIIKNILDLKWIEEVKNILIFGPTNSGKTHLAIAVGTRAIDNGFKVSYNTMTELLDLLRTERVLLKSKYQLNRIMSSKVIIIDGFGLIPLTNHERNLFFQFLNRIYGKVSLIITSNTAPEQWKDMIAEPGIINLIMDRVGYKVCLKGILN